MLVSYPADIHVRPPITSGALNWTVSHFFWLLRPSRLNTKKDQSKEFYFTFILHSGSRINDRIQEEAASSASSLVLDIKRIISRKFFPPLRAFFGASDSPSRRADWSQAFDTSALYRNSCWPSVTQREQHERACLKAHLSVPTSFTPLASFVETNMHPTSIQPADCRRAARGGLSQVRTIL